MTAYVEPQAATDEPRPPIPLVPVSSNQVKAIGYDPETQTLAVTFTRGTGHFYHYPNVSAEAHAAFVGAESIGKFFGKHIQGLTFKKYAPVPEPAAAAAPVPTAPADYTPPFPISSATSTDEPCQEPAVASGGGGDFGGAGASGSWDSGSSSSDSGSSSSDSGSCSSGD